MTNFDLEKRSEMPKASCINCGQDYQGYFCPKCGQRKLEGRFTLKESSGWILDKIFNLERGIFYTIKELFLHPREMLSSYLNRATIRYMHPFRFVFLMATISALLTVICGAFETVEMMQGLEGFTEGYNQSNEKEPTSVERSLEVLEVIKKYLAFFMLANLPLNSLGSYILYFRKRLNFTEHLIINCYMYGFSLVLSLPLYFLLLIDEGMLIYSGVNTLVYVISYAYIFSKFFEEHILEGVVKAIGQFVIAGILLVILIFATVVFYALIKKSFG